MIINIAFTILMLALAVWDLRTFGTNNHKDFKSLIMSIGILGTFAGIFVGLLGFDTKDLLSSVPMLLDGLKTAFYTSIIGMGLAIALSIYQKGKSKTDEANELDFIATQAHKFDELLHLRELSYMSASLREIKAEITKKEDFEKDLKQILKEIDTSLHKALETLASGASKELIKALEIVISDFNNNLKEQFGENFKQLNLATHNMLTWQEHYKDQIIDNTNALHAMQQTLKDAQDTMQQASESISANKENLLQIQLYNEQNHAMQDQLTHALQTLQALGNNFEEKLHAIADLKDSSLTALQSSKDFIQSLQQAKENLHAYLCDYERQLLGFFEQSCNQMNSTNATLQTQNSTMLESMRTTYKEFQDSMQRANIEVLESFEKASQTSNDLAHTINEDIQTKSNALLSLSKDFSSNADSMLHKLDDTTQKSLQHAQSLQEQMRALFEEQFGLLHTKVSHTIDVLQDTLRQNANNLQNFTKDSIQTLTNVFEERDKALQEALQNNYERIVENVDSLHKNLQEKVSKDYQYMQDKILESAQTTHEFLQESAKEFVDSGKTNLHASIETTQALAKEYAQTLHDMQQRNLTQIEEHIAQTKTFLTQTQDDTLKALTSLHSNALEHIETTSKQATQDTISSLENIHTAYKSNIESSLQTTHEHLQNEMHALHETTKETLHTMQEGLQTQHTKTTDSISAVIRNSSQHFIQTSDDFVALLKEQYKRMNTTFDKQGQEIQDFLQKETQTMQQSLLTQNENLQNALGMQTQTLQHNLEQKGEVLHEFLQTQTTCLDTNLQQMLSKFNKMLEHNYMNLTDMLEKDNNLIVKSLDSQAINLSNSLLESHKRLDDFLHGTYEKIANNANAVLDKITNNSTTLSRNLTLTGDSLKENLESLVNALQNTHTTSQKVYDERLEHALKTQQTIITDIQEKSTGFYDTLGKNLEHFTQRFQDTNTQIHASCQGILEDMQNIRDTNQTLSKEVLAQTKDSYMQLHSDLQTNLKAVTDGIAEQFGAVMQKNEVLLQSFEEKVTHFGTTLEGFDSNTKTNFENLNTHFKNLCIQYIKLMQASMQANLKSQKEATQELHKAVGAIQTNVETIAKSSNVLLTQQKESLNEVVQHFKANTQEIVKQGAALHENLGANLTLLDSKMEKMTESFANNYEWFLKKVKEIMGVA